MPVSIMLDAGHGGRDPGAVYNGRQEKDDVLKLVLAIGELLQNSGIDVEYTRTTDIYETPFQKAMEANEAGVDFFISIHRNSSPLANQYMGVESLIYNLSGIKYEMAENINAQLETVGFKDLGVKARPNLVVLRRTKMPAILVEVGFINSDSDNTLFDKNFNDIALAITDGILDTLEEKGLWKPVGARNNTDIAETDSTPSELIPPDENRDSDSVENESPDITPSEKMSSSSSITYSIQVGAFRNSLYAKRLLNEMTEMDFPARIDTNSPFDRVLVGEYDTLQDAVMMERRLKQSGYPTVIVSFSDDF